MSLTRAPQSPRSPGIIPTDVLGARNGARVIPATRGLELATIVKPLGKPGRARQCDTGRSHSLQSKRPWFFKTKEINSPPFPGASNPQELNPRCSGITPEAFRVPNATVGAIPGLRGRQILENLETIEIQAPRASGITPAAFRVVTSTVGAIPFLRGVRKTRRGSGPPWSEASWGRLAESRGNIMVHRSAFFFREE